MPPAARLAFGPFEGKQAQEAAKDAARAAGVASPLVVSLDRTSFYAFDGAEARGKFMLARAGRCELFEKVERARPFRPFLDLDAKGPAAAGLDAVRVETVRAAAVAVALAWGVPAAAAGCDTAAAYTAGKSSAHIVARGWRVPDGPGGAAFAGAVRDALPPEIAACIDLGALGGKAAARTLGLRPPGVPKLVRAHVPGVYAEGSILEPVGDAPSSIPEWCLQGGAADSLPVYGPPGGVPHASHDPVDVEEGGLPPAARARLVEQVEARTGGVLRLDPVPSAGSLLSWSRAAPGWCPACLRNHETDGAYVRRAGDTFYANCRRSGVGVPPLAVAWAHPATANEFPPPDRFRAVTADRVEVARFNGEAFGDELAGPADIYLRAGWCTGKTYVVNQLIDTARARLISARRAAALDGSAPKSRKLCAAPGEPRVLVISSRQSLTTKVVRDLDGLDYRDAKRFVHRGGRKIEAILRDSPAIVCQVDSMGLLPSDLPPFDLVVVDEPVALIDHVFSDSARHDARKGMSLAMIHIERAGRLYVCDNNLATAHVDAFRQARPGRPARVLHNTHQAWRETGATIYTGAASAAEVRRQLLEFVADQVERWRRGRPWEGCVVPAHAIATARGIFEQLAALYPDAEAAGLFKLYTGETPAAVKREDFSDATSAWGCCLAVIYTTTVSVGVSAETARLSTVFAFFDGKNVPAVQSAQMLFRAREVKRLVVSFAGGRPEQGLPQTPRRLYEWATIAANRGAIPDGHRGDVNPHLAEQTQEDPEALERAVSASPLGELWVAAVMVRNHSRRWFVEELAAILREGGVEVEVEHLFGIGSKGGESDNRYAGAGLALATAAARSAGASGTIGDVVEGATALRDALQVTHNQGVKFGEQAARGRAALAAEGYPPVFGEYSAAQSRGEDYLELVRRAPEPDELELQGRRALFIALTYTRGGGLQPADLQEVADLPPEARALWVRWYGESARVQGYAGLAAHVLGVERGVPVLNGEIPVLTTSGREAGALAAKVFDALGLGSQLARGGGAQLTLDTLRAPGPELLAALSSCAEEGGRVFNDPSALRKKAGLTAARAAGKAPALVTLKALLGPPLRHMGAVLVAGYRTERARAKGEPEYYRLAWGWQEVVDRGGAPWMTDWSAAVGCDGRRPLLEVPRPCPRHPAKC